MKELQETKALEYYLNMNYPFLVYRAEEGGYVAEIEELPGCITQGETLEEVSKSIEDARRAWIEVAYEDGMGIPSPRTEQEYSGRFVLRIPSYLHQRLAERATREGVSLNQFVGTLLSAGASTYDAKIEQLIEEVKQLKSQLTDLSKQPTTPTPSYLAPRWGVSSELSQPESRQLTAPQPRELVAA